MKKQVVETPEYKDGEVIVIKGMKIPAVTHTFPDSPPLRLIRVVKSPLSAISCESDFKGNKRRIPIPLDGVYQDPKNPSVEIRQYVGAFRVQNLEPEVHSPHRNHHR